MCAVRLMLNCKFAFILMRSESDQQGGNATERIFRMSAQTLRDHQGEQPVHAWCAVPFPPSFHEVTGCRRSCRLRRGDAAQNWQVWRIAKDVERDLGFKRSARQGVDGISQPDGEFQYTFFIGGHQDIGILGSLETAPRMAGFSEIAMRLLHAEFEFEVVGEIAPCAGREVLEMHVQVRQT